VPYIIYLMLFFVVAMLAMCVMAVP